MISFIQEKNFPSTCLLHPSEYNIVNWHLQKSTENILLHVFSTFFLQNFESSSFSYKHTLYRTRLKDKSVLLTGYNYFSFTFFFLLVSLDLILTQKGIAHNKLLHYLDYVQIIVVCTIYVHSHHYYHHQSAFVS